MNWAHVHLMINHFPVFGMPFALAIFLFALWSRHEPTKTFALYTLITVGPHVVVLDSYSSLARAI